MDLIFDTLIKAIQQFHKKKILVIGDLMVDEYIMGKVTRISPEAPVPILKFSERKLEAGGASNVANNIASLGGTTYIVGVIDKDESGKWLEDHLKNNGIYTDGLVNENNRPTIIKTRFATKGQQLLRVDNENTQNISLITQQKILHFLNNNINNFDAVILSDYRKGVLGDILFVKKIINTCKKNGIFVSVDSKSKNIEAFENADFVKPNNLELEAAVGFPINNEESLNYAGKEYLRRSHAKSLVVTRGAKGISLFRFGNQREDFSAAEVQVYDVTGAGDTVISTITLGMISGLKIDESIRLANLAAGKVISEVGTIPIKQEDLLQCLLNSKKEFSK